MDLISKINCKIFVKKFHKLYYFLKYYILEKILIKRYNSNRIILFRLDLLGDCTMFTSSAIAIHEFYKDKPLTIVCLDSSKSIFERLNICEEIITVDFKPENIEYPKLQRVIDRIREKEYDILLQPQISKYPLADILAIATKCNKRISIKSKADNSSGKWIKLANTIYDKLIDYTSDKVVSEFQYYGEFIRGLGYSDYKTKKPYLPYHKQNFVENKYYIIYPGGSLSCKWWPAERYAEIADYVYTKTGFKGVILGVVSEGRIATDIISYSKCKTDGLHNFVGKTTINDLIDLIGNAQFVISNDTSGVHIACATNTPSVAIMGGWHFGRFLPYNLEDNSLKDNLPFIAYNKMECFNCDWHREKIRKTNPECLDSIYQGKLLPCISMIQIDTVKDIVNKVIMKGKQGYKNEHKL